MFQHQLIATKANPHELTNLIGWLSHREVAEVMGQRLLKRMREAGEAEATIEAAPEPATSGLRRVTPEEARS